MKTSLRVLADTIIDGLHTIAASELQDLLHDVLLSIKDDMVRTILFRQRGLFRGRSRPYYTGSELLCKLEENQ